MKSDPFFSREVQDDIEVKDARDLGRSLFFHFPDFLKILENFPVQTLLWIGELPIFSHLCSFAFCDIWAGCTQPEVVCEAGGCVCRQVKHLPQQGHLLEQLQSAETSCDLLLRTCSRCTTVGGCVHLFARCSLVYRPQLHLRLQDTRKLRISTLKLTHFCVKLK